MSVINNECKIVLLDVDLLVKERFVPPESTGSTLIPSLILCNRAGLSIKLEHIQLHPAGRSRYWIPAEVAGARRWVWVASGCKGGPTS